MTTLTFTALGIPAAQGSKRHIGGGVLIEQSKRVRPWRATVTHAGRQQRGTAEPLTGPIQVDLLFAVPRPRSHYRTGRNAHLLRDGAPVAPGVAPDLDKYVRAALDGITDAGIWGDDGQVVAITARKVYAGAGDLTQPGLIARITGLQVSSC